MRILLLSCLMSVYCSSQGQFTIPAYTIKNDSATHTTVVHLDGAELRRIKMDPDTTLAIKIQPDIKITNGVVDHKNLTGEIFVREYYVENKMIGYVEYNGSDIKRELYYNAAGNIFLEKRYKANDLIYTNNNIQILPHYGTGTK